MSFIADLHIHSYYSRATSKQLNLEHLNKWAQLKGIQVVATGDFTHPQWLTELEEKLAPAEDGLFTLKDEFKKLTQAEVFKACESPVRFILSTEISSIYKKNDKVRKVHSVVLTPSFEAARRLQTRLEKIGNIRSDGRPILGLDAKNLLEIVLETDDSACLIPAHIWTPWFSVLGSSSGFDSIQECFDDLTPYIFALETGLSSDPPMNWRLSQLDKYVLISNSDAHSPQKLARESNIFHCQLSYSAMLNALKTKDPSLFGGTIEFFPEEGKYHFDGHRKCNVRLSPEETVANNDLCPVCGKKVTLGVCYRVNVLADRLLGEKPLSALPYQSLIPLPEIVAEAKDVGPNSKAVTKIMENLLTKLGAELTILKEVPLEDIKKVGGSLLAEGVRRMRTGEVKIAAGYDGEYGVIHLFSDEERKHAQTLFPDSEVVVVKKVTPAKPKVIKDAPDESSKTEPTIMADDEEQKYGGLNEAQFQAVHHTDSHLLIVAGPGTGKTKTLTQRIAYLINQNIATADQILAITFTNKAAEEMRERLSLLLDKEIVNQTTIKTFHAFGALILQQQSEVLDYQPNFSIYNEKDQFELLKEVTHLSSQREIREIADKISQAKNQLLTPEHFQDDASFSIIYKNYEQALRLYQAFDFDDLIDKPITLLQNHPKILKQYHKRFCWISVDEYQDINLAQYQLLKLLITPKSNLCAIGDPDQAIYGFRGSDYKYFNQFKDDFPTAKTICLNKNYRSNQTIVSASKQVIEKQPDREPIDIWSNIISENKIEIIKTPTEKSEAETVVHRIEQLVQATSFFSIDSGRTSTVGEDQKNISFADISILYRMHAQLPALEEALLRSGIPYQVYGEVPFWEQPEVKEIISYLRVLINPNSDNDLRRILNTPPRGIGELTLKAIFNYKNTNHLPLWRTLEKAHFISSLSASQRDPIEQFVLKIRDLQHELINTPITELIDKVIKISGLASYYKNDQKRIHYWKAIVGRCQDWQGSISGFLEQLALQSETDNYDHRVEKITLLTLHAAKGLEFPIVFIVGCEEGVVPYKQRHSEYLNVDEERRLFYVGMTRAKSKLFLCYSLSRFLHGNQLANPPSRFLHDIQEVLKDHQNALLKKKHVDRETPDDRQLTLL
jgi:DNA helicase II / ATP-dependent DNA helicase PcrA